MSQHTPGPCESLARLALQSERYSEDAEFRDAVDAVLGQPVFDAAPDLLEAAKAFLARVEKVLGKSIPSDWKETFPLQAAIAKADGKMP